MHRKTNAMDALLEPLLRSPKLALYASALQTALDRERRDRDRLSAGTIASLVVEGFSMPIRALFDEKANFEALHSILKPPIR